MATEATIREAPIFKKVSESMKLAKHKDGTYVEGTPGICFDIDGCSMHNDGTWCPICKFGIKGTFGEPIVKPRSVQETIEMRKAGATWKR